MAATDVITQTISPTNDMDDSLFDYDVGEVFRDVDTNMDVPAVPKPTTSTKGKENGASLGIDEEVQVTKKRVNVPKLDLNRLLSPAGIPKLRRVAKERLKFKGKGHEYSDVARLLNAYQLWLDDLYPRVKFADGLAMIEKLGHTKRMQIMRREWIQEGRPRETSGSLGEGAENLASQQTSGQDLCSDVESTERSRSPVGVIGGDDLYAAPPRNAPKDEMPKGHSDTENLFFEGSTKTVPVLGQKRRSPAREKNFDDDEEALLALNVMW